MNHLEWPPPASSRNVAVRIDRSGERAIRQGHPWLYDSGVTSQSHQAEAGDLAVLFDRHRNFLAIGLYDPHSPLRVRVIHQGKPVPLDGGFYRRRFEDLAKRRESLRSRTTGWRVVHGENEGMPGFVVDRYADTLVVKLYTPAWIRHLREVLAALREVESATRIVLRLSRDTRARGEELFGLEDGQILLGSDLASPLPFEEDGLQLECDPVHGHKTGFFLDQRDNRALVEELTQDRQVVDVFCYTGGFSLRAARGGARSVLSVDQSEPALEVARRHFRTNRGDPKVAAAKHEVRAGDGFEALRSLREARRRFGVVILDPPSLSGNRSTVPKALSAYQRLVSSGLQVLEPGGTLVMASCSAQIPAEEFFRVVHRTARDRGRPLREIRRTGHAVDHPVGFPQGAYLKCLFATA